MKKELLLSFFSIIVVCSCQSAQKYMTGILSKTYIGMSESEFKGLTENERMVYMDENQSIYKIERTQGKGSAHKFFYFQNNRLMRIDEGERATDFRIKVD